MRRFFFESRLALTVFLDWSDDHPATASALVLVTVFAISGAIVFSAVAP